MTDIEAAALEFLAMAARARLAELKVIEQAARIKALEEQATKPKKS